MLFRYSDVWSPLEPRTSAILSITVIAGPLLTLLLSAFCGLKRCALLRVLSDVYGVLAIVLLVTQRLESRTPGRRPERFLFSGSVLLRGGEHDPDLNQGFSDRRSLVSGSRKSSRGGGEAMLRVKDLMNHMPEVVSPDAHLHDVLVKMNRAGYRHMPVVANERIVGIITDRDLRLAVNSPVVEEEGDLKRETVLDKVRVDQCMTPDPQCVSSNTPLHEVADLLSLNKFGAMPVADEGKLVGMISYIDFLKHYAASR